MPGPGFPGAGFTKLVERGGALGPPPLLFDPDLVAFTPSMDKRLSPGPFYTAPIHQGAWDVTGTPDVVTLPRGDLTGNQAQLTYANLDPYQGSFVLWITPEWDVDTSGSKYFFDFGTILLRTNGADGLWFSFHDGGSWNHVNVDITAWVAGTAYLVIGRWDTRNPLDGVNGMCLSVNNVHTYGVNDLDGEAAEPIADMYLGCSDASAQGANAIVEGFTLYRRPLLSGDGYGIRPMNGNRYSNDEMLNIYAAGVGADPVLITGSEGVCTCVPTNSTAEALASGDGEAWSWPWDQNLPDVWGAWDGGLPGTDYAVEFNGATTIITVTDNATIQDLHDAEFTTDTCIRMDGWGEAEGNLLDKSHDQTLGWRIAVREGNTGVNAAIYCAGVGTDARSRVSGLELDGKVHLITTYYNDAGDRKIYIAIDGRWATTYVLQVAATAAVDTDVGENLYIGNSFNAVRTMDGAIVWAAIWSDDHHVHGTDFIAPRAPPAPGGNLVDAWWMDEGTGVTATAQVTVPGNNGTIANGAWSSIWAVDGTPIVPYSLEFFQQNDGIDFGSGVNIDDLPSGDCTFEFWARIPPDIAADVDVFSKTNVAGAIGWMFYVVSATRLRCKIHHATDADINFDNYFDNIWHHFAVDWDQGTLTARGFVDGILVDTDTAVGAYVADAAEDCLVNARGAIGTGDGAFAIGPIRLSNNRRYAAGTFVPPDRVNWLANDANAHLITLMRDGAGATVTDYSGNAYHGTVTFGADTKWHTTPDMEYDEPGAPINRDGYNIGLVGDFGGMAFYVDATAGNDANSGLTPAEAWQTIGKVNGETFLWGDRVLFKRGETWVGGAVELRLTWSGAADYPITFAAYGTGALPVLWMVFSPSAQSYIALQDLDCNVNGGFAYAGQLDLDHSALTNCTFRNATSHGLQLDSPCDTVTISGCEAYDNGDCGFYLGTGTANCIVEDCVAHDNGVDTSADHGIYFRQGADHIIRRNVCYNNAAGGIKLNESTDCIVERNYCYDNTEGIILTGGGGEPDALRNIIKNNICYSNTANGIQVLADFDDGWIYHNTLVNNGGVGLGSQLYFQIAGADNTIVENNILHQDNAVGNDPLLRIVDTATRNANTFDNNLYYFRNGGADINYVDGVGWYTWAEWQAAGEDPNGLNADPLFVTDYTDLHLRFGSPCRNQGAVGTGVTDDYDGVTRGSPPDIGAYEYV